MTSKLLAVVKRQRQHLLLVLAQRLDNRLGDAFCFLVGHKPQLGVACLAFHQRHNRPLVPCTNHGVRFPVSYPVAGFNFCRAFGNGPTVGYLAATFRLAVSLFACFLAAQRLVDLATLLLVSQDPLVDPFVAYRVLALFEHAADLFRAPAFLQQRHGKLVEQRPPWLMRLALGLQALTVAALGFTCLITATLQVASQLPADHAFTATDALTNRGRAKPFCIQCLDLVSFTFGEMMVFHFLCS